MHGNNIPTSSCYNDVSFLLQHGFDPRHWSDDIRVAFSSNPHRKCPISHCTLNDDISEHVLPFQLEDSLCKQCDSTLLPISLSSTPTTPITYDVSMQETHDGYVRIPSVPCLAPVSSLPAATLKGVWTLVHTINLTERLNTELGASRHHFNGLDYYTNEWPVVLQLLSHICVKRLPLIVFGIGITPTLFLKKKHGIQVLHRIHLPVARILVSNTPVISRLFVAVLGCFGFFALRTVVFSSYFCVMFPFAMRAFTRCPQINVVQLLQKGRFQPCMWVYRHTYGNNLITITLVQV